MDIVDQGAGTGTVTVEVHGPDGTLKSSQTVHNLITDIGDAYQAAQVITGVSPANPSAPTRVNGMKLGTGTTAAAKAGAGAALVTYITGSNRAFDSTYPQAINGGAGNGVSARYKVTFPAGQATNAAITEAVIVTDAGTDGAGNAAATIARVVFSATPKGTLDTLTVTWDHLQKGA